MHALKERLNHMLFGHSTIPMEIYAVLYTIAWGARTLLPEELLGNIVHPDYAFILSYLRLCGIFVGVLYGIVLINNAVNLRKFMMALVVAIWVAVVIITLIAPVPEQSEQRQVIASLVYIVNAAAFGWTFVRMKNGISREFVEAASKILDDAGRDFFAAQVMGMKMKLAVQDKHLMELAAEISRLLIRIDTLETMVTLHAEITAKKFNGVKVE